MIVHHIRRLHTAVRPHYPQLFRYLISGFSAAGMEILSYEMMLQLGIPYQIGTFASGAVGITATFLLQKYVVFRKKSNWGAHTIRFAILTAFNYIVQNSLVIGFVEFLGLPPILAKILSIGCSVLWNFVLYKFFVYV